MVITNKTQPKQPFIPIGSSLFPRSFHLICQTVKQNKNWAHKTMFGNENRRNKTEEGSICTKKLNAIRKDDRVKIRVMIPNQKLWWKTISRKRRELDIVYRSRRWAPIILTCNSCVLFFALLSLFYDIHNINDYVSDNYSKWLGIKCSSSCSHVFCCFVSFGFN